jgi:enoyl-CoA hydratase/carnithine racemase
MSGEITTDIDTRGVGTIWIDNPAHRNAMNDALIEALLAAFLALGRDDACRVVVLRGRGGIFCAGRELRDLRALNQSPMDKVERAYERLRQVNEAIYFCPRPTLCVIEKYAFGLGATLVSWCDMALADSEALISYPEVHHGITPAPAVMALQRGVTRKAMMDILLTGRRIGMEEAVPMGLVNRAVPRERLDAEIAATLKGLLRGSPSAVRRTKEFIWHSEDTGHRAAMASAVGSISLGLGSGETREGIGAFLDKRDPPWVKP